MSENDHRIVGITSASPGAGKSFISSNLAASLSQLSNHDIVLVDLDFQRASIADLFGLEGARGIADLLEGEEDDVANVAQSIGDTGLTVVPTFLRSVNSAELLAGERFANVMKKLREVSNNVLVICDLPPLFVSDDALLAAQHLDGVLLVVEQGVTTKKQVQASLQMLYPTRIYGTVFNRYSGGFADPYGYGGAYGGYYNNR